MKYLRRILYLLYYLKKTDFSQIRSLRKYVTLKTGKTRISLMLDVLFSIFKYNISFKDYYCGRFYESTKEERKDWAGSGFMYEYQLEMNPKKVRNTLENKILFLNHFRDFVKREHFNLQEMIRDAGKAKKLLTNSSGRLVLKNSLGQVGAEVEVFETENIEPGSLINYMKKNKYDLAEEYVIQHPSIMALSPSGLNTIRIFTQLLDGRVEFLGARFRISVNSSVDNMGAGNLAAPVNIETGIVNGPAVYSDITREDNSIHPITKKMITEFKIPFWPEVKDLATRASLHNPENKSVGWDIAITVEGPELIEGNHNWCRLLWQMPVKQGLKPVLEQYL